MSRFVINLANYKFASYKDAFEACKTVKPDIKEVPYMEWRKILNQKKVDAYT